MTDRQEVTALLQEINDGGVTAPEKLLPLVYDELRKLAKSYMQNERSDHTLQPTALVHDAYIRLVDWENVSWQNRAHFFSVAARVMRNILVDYAVKRNTQKRGSGPKLSLDEAISIPGQGSREIDLVRLDDALQQLASFDITQAKIVELRFFGGLTIEETAHTMGISPATVKREWSIAKAWLFRTLKDE